jgi:transcriptional regulator with XRE-family HTH domain
MVTTRIKEIAEARGMSLSQLQRRADVSMGAMRKYWHNSAEGKAGGKPLAVLDLEVLGKVAGVLEVRVLELLVEE